MHNGNYGLPDKYLVLEFKYYRKAVIAHIKGDKIRYFIYLKLSKHYENKHYKKLMSS